MRVAIAAIGSRGDALPFAHLAARFASAGHSVSFITHEVFTDLVDSSVRAVPVSSDPRVLLAGQAGRAVRRWWNPCALNRTRDEFADFIHSLDKPAREVLGDADVLVASTFAMAAVNAALAQSIPVVRAHMWPEFPGFDGPMPLLPYAWLLPPAFRRLARRSLSGLEPYLGGVQGWWRRGRLHLAARHPVHLTTATVGSLYAMSAVVVPEQPAEGVVTGWWTDPRPATVLSDHVQEVLDSGGDWIHVGFGSMAQDAPEDLLHLISRACARVGVSAIVQLGALRGRLRHNVFCIGEEPHDQLFRRVRATLHHGGAGTTAAAVRAGVPSVVVPHFADQFWWGRRLHELGVATRPLPRPFLTERALARRIQQALDPAMHLRAAALGERVHDEDGCGRAVAQVERWLGDRVRR